METYRVSEKEIVEEFVTMLDDIEGDFSSWDLKRAYKKMREIIDDYAHTSDRCFCETCEKMFQVYKKEKDMDKGIYSFKCPYCGKSA